MEKEIGSKKITEIKRQHITAIHAAISTQVKKSKNKTSEKKYKSASTANRILALASTVFSHAVRIGACEYNPARGIKKSPERSRDRFLQSEELPKFFDSLSKEPDLNSRDYFMLALLTGARRSNLLSMRWQEISFDRKEWRIPRTKNDEPQIVPLLEEAIDILNKRKNESEFVFPGRGKSGYLSDMRNAWVRIIARAGIENLRVHDLRRTVGSWQAITGSSALIIGKSLGHKSIQATAVYARLNIAPIRNSMEKAFSAMLESGKQMATFSQINSKTI